MGRPAIVEFASFTDPVALEATASVLKTEKNTTVTAVTDRLRKRVKLTAADEALFVARVLASLKTLESQSKVVLDNGKVTVVVGKRGRPRKVTPATEATA
jgi:hypothetical protein